MSKHQMIEMIRERNRSVSSEYLVRFNEQALASYLRRLTDVLGKRGRDSVWVREGVSPAVTGMKVDASRFKVQGSRLGVSGGFR